LIWREVSIYRRLVRGQRSLVTGAALVAVAALFSAGFGVAASRTAGGAEVPCKPKWFVPSLSFKIVQDFVQPDVNYMSLWRRGVCHIDRRHPFSFRLLVVGHGGATISDQSGAFSGDMNPGGSGGGGASIRLATLCAHQPVRVSLTGAGPDYARTGKGYRLTLGPLSIRCQ
jgi:hypothetical protein